MNSTEKFFFPLAIILAKRIKKNAKYIKISGGDGTYTSVADDTHEGKSTTTAQLDDRDYPY